MKKLIILFFIFCSIAKANAKDYTIESLQGLNQHIQIIPDYPNNILTIKSSNDSLKLFNFTNIEDQVTILNKKFLKISYSILGGSDVDYRHIVLICINKNKICESLNVLCLLSGETNTVFDEKADSMKLFDEKMQYKIEINLINKVINEPQLIINIYDQKISKRYPNENYSLNQKVLLYFDKKKNIFFSGLENIEGSYTIDDLQSNSEFTQYISGKYLTVRLGKCSYYFIDGNWYEKDEHNYLLKYSSKERVASNLRSY